MVCRSTPGNSALTTFARLHSGLEDVQVLSMFHEIRGEVPQDTPAPTQAEYQDFLTRAISRVRADDTLSNARRESILARLDRAMTQRPDGRTYYAWRNIEERATRARAALDAQFAEIARTNMTTVDRVEQAFNTLVEANADQGRNAPTAPEHVNFETANMPRDRATRWALTMLHYGGPLTAGDTGRQERALERATHRSEQIAREAAQNCPECGQFAGDDHACPAVTNTRIPGVLGRAGDRLAETTDGQWRTSDGERWDTRLRAFRHEVGLVQQEDRIEAEMSEPDPGDRQFTVPIPGLRDAHRRLRRTQDEPPVYRTTDGTTFHSRADAARHERGLLWAERQDVADRTPLRLTEARDRLRRTPTGVVTSDGRLFADVSTAIQHERGLPRTMAQVHVDGATSWPRPGTHEQTPSRPDMAHDEALADLRERLTGEPATAASGAVPGQRCDNCGQFTGPRHVCPENADGESVTTYDEHGNEIPPSYGTGQDTPVATVPVTNLTPQAAPATPPAPAPAPAPARQRRRTPIRTYTPDGPLGLSARMMNRSQVLADLREAGVGEPVNIGAVQVTVPYITTETNMYGQSVARHRQALVDGTVTAVATSARSRRGQDRIVVHPQDPATGERTLRCTCPDYRERYDCEHVRAAVETMTAVLNDRDAIAVAPPAAVADARSALHAEYQGSLAAQQQARANFAEAATGPAYSEDMTAFQAAWDEAKEHFASGETRLPYMTENATGGLGARDGGRSFGIEIEVDFPDDMTYTAKNRVARELYEAGLSRGPQVRGWHWAGRAGGGYSDAPNNWAVEFDRSVDDVGGQRGCEIVSPILYDEPQTWQNLAKVCEIIERNGGRATPRTGLHINVGAGDFDHTVENHNRLLRLSTAYEDVLVRVAHNPQSGSTHRGRAYCSSSQVPAGGYRRIRDAQLSNGHRSMVNLDHVPAEHQEVTNSTRVEVRIFDGAVDPGRIQTNVKVALGLVNAATRGVEPATEPEAAGTHRRRNAGPNGRARRLRGEEWTNDTASFRAFADAIFSRPEDKAQMVHAFAATRWQAR